MRGHVYTAPGRDIPTTQPGDRWFLVNGSSYAAAHAQGLLGDLVYVELPSVGDTVKAGNACAVVESVKAASDVYAPVSGEIVAVNDALPDKPETINEDAYGDGWLFVIKPDSLAEELEELLDPDAYAELIESEDH